MRPYCLVLFLLFIGKGFGQSQWDQGFLPKLMLSKKYGEDFRWIHSIESRTDANKETTLNSNLIDLSSILSFRTDVHHTINIGYILRFEESKVIHRTFQHFNYLQTFSASTLAHRWALEQFFDPSSPFYLRGRYRALFQKPLNGERIDAKEFYFKIGNEYLWNLKDNELEIRLTPYLGYQLSQTNRIEFGFDYRTVRFIENNLWFRTTWYISI